MWYAARGEKKWLWYELPTDEETSAHLLRCRGLPDGKKPEAMMEFAEKIIGLHLGWKKAVADHIGT